MTGVPRDECGLKCGLRTAMRGGGDRGRSAAGARRAARIRPSRLGTKPFDIRAPHRGRNAFIILYKAGCMLLYRGGACGCKQIYAST